VSEIILEKLFEQRDFYLNTIKHLEFQLIIDPAYDELQQNKKIKNYYAGIKKSGK